MITLKARRNQGFTLFLEDTFLKKTKQNRRSNPTTAISDLIRFPFIYSESFTAIFLTKRQPRTEVSFVFKS